MSTLTISNDGNRSITINQFILNGTAAENIIALNGSTTIAPGEIVQFKCDSAYDYDVGDIAFLNAYVYEVSSPQNDTTTVSS